MNQNNDITQKYEYTLGFDGADASSYAHIQNENIESEVDAEDVSLKSFQIKKELESNIWDENGDLDLKVRKVLLEVSDDFWETCNIRWVKPTDAILTGSICNFNWSSYSDIDLHLIVDFSKIHHKKEFVKEYFDEKKNDWNNNHKSLKIYGYPIELYVQDIDENPESGGIYDLYENKWIRKPKNGTFSPIKLNKYAIKNVSAKIMTKIDDLCDAFDGEEDKHKLEMIGKYCDKIQKELKKIRQIGLKDSEMGSGNICYKVVRRSGYMEKLWKLQDKVYDKLNSIEESLDFAKRLKRKF